MKRPVKDTRVPKAESEGAGSVADSVYMHLRLKVGEPDQCKYNK
jgi:hypothetical protein